ncbi:MAG: DNA replication/repair protein RecF [Ethanoligenens sp.]
MPHEREKNSCRRPNFFRQHNLAGHSFMITNSLSLRHFRNLEETVLQPDPAVNIFYGQNAQGKTNLLEAIWMFTGSRSFRNAKDSELLAFHEKQAQLELTFTAGKRIQQASITFQENKRRVRLNDVPLKSSMGLAGEFCAVIFAPEHLALVKDGPAVRRTFLDEAICPLRPRHAAILSAYHKALIQRNALLKDIPHHMELLDTLDIWDERISKLGASILFARLRYLARLLPKAERLHQAISSSHEKAAFQYESAKELKDCLQAETLHAVEIEQALLNVLQNRRRIDIETGITGAGPHRDDILIHIAGLPARTFASQGQQRTAALALKLAEAEVLNDVIGEPPILLLDDVFSELDAVRREYLINHIDNAQVFITCCDPQGLAPKAGAVFSLSNGQIRRGFTAS